MFILQGFLFFFFFYPMETDVNRLLSGLGKERKILVILQEYIRKETKQANQVTLEN